MPNDGDIIGLDKDGHLIQWDADHEQPYCSAETPEEFGLNNITVEEWEIIEACKKTQETA